MLFWIVAAVIAVGLSAMLWWSARPRPFVNTESHRQHAALEGQRRFLTNEDFWKMAAKKGNAEVAIKRRAKLIAEFNHLKARQLTSASALLEITNFLKRLDRIRQNPSKFLRVVVWLALPLMALSAHAQDLSATDRATAEQLLTAGNTAYEAKAYSTAQEKYQTLLSQYPTYKRAVVAYKAGLSAAKQKDHARARDFYTIAYLADPATGGASTLAKFVAKIRESGLSLSDLRPATDDSSVKPGAEGDVTPPPPLSEADKTAAEKLLSEANSRYSAKDFTGALSQYEQLLSRYRGYKTSVVAYKAGLTAAKLKDCARAAGFYRQAFTADPSTGGASSLTKFEEKISECGLSWADVRDVNLAADQAAATATDAAEAYPEQLPAEEPSTFDLVWTTLGAIPVGLIAGFLLYTFGLQFFTVRTKEQYLRQCRDISSDNSLWDALRKSHGPQATDQLRELWVRAVSAVSSGDSDQQPAHLYGLGLKLRADATGFFDDSHYGSDRSLLWGFQRHSPLCFFEGIAADVDAKPPAVIQLRHPGGYERLVWATPQMLRKAQQGAKLKVRMHKVAERWTHWSNDPDYFDPIGSAERNRALQMQYYGEPRFVDLQKCPEVFVGSSEFYIPPPADAIPQAVVEVLGPVAQETGFEPSTETNDTARTGDYDDGGDTLIIVDSMTNDRSHRDDDYAPERS